VGFSGCENALKANLQIMESGPDWDDFDLTFHFSIVWIKIITV
jgi:hypothetical protein